MGCGRVMTGLSKWTGNEKGHGGEPWPSGRNRESLVLDRQILLLARDARQRPAGSCSSLGSCRRRDGEDQDVQGHEGDDMTDRTVGAGRWALGGERWAVGDGRGARCSVLGARCNRRRAAGPLTAGSP